MLPLFLVTSAETGVCVVDEAKLFRSKLTCTQLERGLQMLQPCNVVPTIEHTG